MAQIVGDGVNHALRNLRPAGAVEEGGGVSVDGLGERGELGADVGEVEGGESGCVRWSAWSSIFITESETFYVHERRGGSAAGIRSRRHPETWRTSAGCGILRGRLRGRALECAPDLSPRPKGGSAQDEACQRGIVGVNLSLFGHCPHEIRQHAVRRRIQAGIFFGDGEAGEDVGFEIDVGRGAGNLAHRRGRQHFFRARRWP